MNYCRKEFHLTRCMASRSALVIDRTGSCNWSVNIFVIISWSKVKVFTQLCLEVSHLRWAQFPTQLLRLTTSFSQLQGRWNRVVFAMLPMLQMFLFQCFKRKFASSELLEKNLRSILSQNYSEISRVYFFGDTNFNFSVNTIILSAIIYCTYYELAARNICLEGRYLVLALLAALVRPRRKYSWNKKVKLCFAFAKF